MKTHENSIYHHISINILYIHISYSISIPHISFSLLTSPSPSNGTAAPPAFAGAQGLKEMCGDAIVLWKLLEPLLGWKNGSFHGDLMVISWGFDGNFMGI
jgi:hypothetical protein